MNLFSVCVNAFVAVLALLSVLALVMRLLIALFPEKVQPVPAPSGDPALTAAMAAAVTMILPGARLTRVEEIR